MMSRSIGSWIPAVLAGLACSCGAPAKSPSTLANTGGATPRLLATRHGCTALAWSDDKMTARPGVFDGHLDVAFETDADGITERAFVLRLGTPACGPDGAPVPEVQIFAPADLVDLDLLVHDDLRVEGEPFAEHTAHHHRPIVVAVKAVSRR
jgi:hypothetical protein